MTTDMLEKEPTVILNRSDDSTTESCDEKQQQSNVGDKAAPKLNDAATHSCPHLKKCVDFSSIKKTLKTNGLENKNCQDCSKDTTTSPASTTTTNGIDISLLPTVAADDPNALLMCLKCGVQLCREGQNQSHHALLHFQKPRSDPHAMFVNTATFSVWCFLCKQYVESAHRKKLLECIEYLKKDAKKVSTNLRQQISHPSPTVKAVETREPAGPSSTLEPNMTTQKGAEENTKISRPTYVPMKLKLDQVSLDSLPRVRGLSNLGNTCFFNAVLQCLAQTPYLSPVLQESAQPDEYVELPGGKLQLDDKNPDDTIDLPPISGNLNGWGNLTETLSETIDELRSGSAGVHNPRKLLEQLSNKWPQFGDGDQHDSHELLRHLLEIVRNQDLRRYQVLILHALGYNSKINPQKVHDDVKKKIKFYGQQASDRILRPEQVFRGFLVSTLMCQDCHHTSSRHENFLDISLPVSQDKPQPPMRRKGSPEPSESLMALPMANDDIFAQSPATASKHQAKKERKKDQKLKRIARKQKIDRNGNVEAAGGDGTEDPLNEDGTKKKAGECNTMSRGDNNDENDKNVAGENDGTAGSDDDDEDDEDDTDADEEDNCQEEDSATNLSNGLLSLEISGNVEKQDDTPENPNKGDFDAKNLVLEVGISESGATNLVQSLDTDLKPLGGKSKPKGRQRTISYSDWSTTIAPRYQCDEGECSVQSCLNNFTGIELMTGNNKVGCEACTERINGKDGKSVNTNATKQFLISSPPAVLILHLKRFQMGQRFMFRKLMRHVTFPFLLDIAPFCGTKVKKLPNVDRQQKKLLYSLYGIVEHSGGMHGGHYVAYVKVRPEMSKDDIRWKFIPQGSKAELDQMDEQRVRIEETLAKSRERMANDSDDALSQSSSDLNEDEGAVGGTPSIDREGDKVNPPPGKWYYVSDSRVSEVSEDAVLKAQAYLLFYERIY